MKTSHLKLAIVAIVAALSGCDKLQTSTADLASERSRIQALEAQVKAAKDQAEADQRLGQYAINMMHLCGGKDKLSDGAKQTLATDIIEVSNAIFEMDDSKKAYITVVAIESCFQRFAQSPTGPKGYAQLARASFHEAMKDCGIEGLKDDDVWNTKLNLYAGACYFRKVLDAFGGDPYAAIVAYNQGPNSEAAKTYAKHGWMDNMEALKYVARFSFLKRKVTDEKTENTPAIQDLPKQTSTIKK